MNFLQFRMRLRIFSATAHRWVVMFEPWGIILALIAFVVSLYAFQVERGAIEDQRRAIEDQRVVNAWVLLTTKATGNSGKISAIEFLNGSGESLTGIDLSVLDNRPGVFLRSARLRNAELFIANLSGAVLVDADLRNANLSFSTLNRVWLRNAKLDGANLESAHLVNAGLAGASFSETNMRNVNLSCANLTRTDFTNADLSGAVVNNAVFYNSIMVGANLEGVDLSTACGTNIVGLPEPFEIVECSTTHVYESNCAEPVRAESLSAILRIPSTLQPLPEGSLGTCPDGQMMCQGNCIPPAMLNDGDADCDYGEDEGVLPACEDNEWRCADGSMCIPVELRCDLEYLDCEDSSDEDNCTG